MRLLGRIIGDSCIVWGVFMLAAITAAIVGGTMLVHELLENIGF